MFKNRNLLVLGVGFVSVLGMLSASSASADCDRSMSARAEVTYRLKVSEKDYTLPVTIKARDSFSDSGHSGKIGNLGCNDARERACEKANGKVQDRYTQQALSDLVCAEVLKKQTDSNGVVLAEILGAQSVCSDPDVTKNRGLAYSKILVNCTNAQLAGLCQNELTKEAGYIAGRAAKFADAVKKQKKAEAQAAWGELIWSHDVFLNGDGKFKDCLK